jgi:hypothetical protein
MELAYDLKRHFLPGPSWYSDAGAWGGANQQVFSSWMSIPQSVVTSTPKQGAAFGYTNLLES